MIVSDFIDVNKATGFFILDSHGKGIPGQRGNCHNDEKYGFYSYNMHNNNKLTEGSVFLYRVPKKPFILFGGGRIESISEPDANGYMVASITNGFEFIEPIVQGSPFIETFKWRNKTKPGRGWQGFWTNYGILRIEKNDFIGLVSNLKCIPGIPASDAILESDADDRLRRNVSSAGLKTTIAGKKHQNTGPKAPPTKRSQKGESYPRDISVALNAFCNADNKCEMDGNHESFIRRGTKTRYCEPHHLVPLKNQGGFRCRLDIEENVVALCSNCHNKIHYGEGATEMIEFLFEKRKDKLKIVGIDIDLETLLALYGLKK